MSANDESWIPQPGERVIVVKPCGLNDKCDLKGKIGTIFINDTRKHASVVNFDETIICDTTERVSCTLQDSDLQSLKVRIIFSFIKFIGNGYCDSTNCGDKAYYTVFDYKNKRSFKACGLHTIEWLNNQFKQIADTAWKLHLNIQKLTLKKPTDEEIARIDSLVKNG